MRICFMVGHGLADDGKTYNPGATHGGYDEFKLARQIAAAAANRASLYDVESHLLNYEGSYTFAQKLELLRQEKYNYACEIHLNAGGGTGTEVYYAIGSEQSHAIAAAASAAVSSALGIRDRGAKTKRGRSGDYFGVIRCVPPISQLVEICFIDSSDLDVIASPQGQKAAGEALADSICSSLGIAQIAPVQPPRAAGAGDMDGDGAVTAEDARLVLRKAIGLD